MACTKNSHCLLFPITFPSLLWNHCQYPNVQISHFVGKVQIFRFAWQQHLFCLCCSLCGVVCHMSGVAVWPGGGTLPLAGDGDGTLPLQSQGSSPLWNRFEVTPAVAVVVMTDRNRLIVTTAATWRVETTRHCAPPSYTTSLCTAAVSGADIGDLIVVQILSITLVLFSE